MTIALEVRPGDVADKAAALEVTGHYAEAAIEYARAATLFAYDGQPGDVERMTQAAVTCRRAAGVTRLR